MFDLNFHRVPTVLGKEGNCFNAFFSVEKSNTIRRIWKLKKKMIFANVIIRDTTDWIHQEGLVGACQLLVRFSIDFCPVLEIF